MEMQPAAVLVIGAGKLQAPVPRRSMGCAVWCMLCDSSRTQGCYTHYLCTGFSYMTV